MPTSFLNWITSLGGVRGEDTHRTVDAARFQVRGPEKASTVFDGDPQAWQAYLAQPFSRRFDGFYHLNIHVGAELESLRITSANERSKNPSQWIEKSFQALCRHLSDRGGIGKILDHLVIGNTTNRDCPLTVVSHESLPAPASREVRFSPSFHAEEARIVIRTSRLQAVDREIELAGSDTQGLELLGRAWPVTGNLLLQLSYPNYPRDRFIERIAITTKWAAVCLHTLFDGKEKGELVPNRAGKIWLNGLSSHSGIPVQHLFARHTLCRLLSDISFLLNSRNADSAMEVAEVIVRDYLDARYLRLGIAGLMPPTPEWMTPMPCQWKGRKRITTPKPVIGRNGILDEEDLNAWKKLEKDFSSIGYFLVGQLGIGQFGRVYEAVNAANPSIPQRVAIKVDRIRKGRKKEAIEAAESIMQTARGLSRSPHVIRIFDAGKLKKARATYHILQLVEGDTLDNLIGITGTEHASILRPQSARSSVADAQKEFLESLGRSHGEAWRKARKASQFLHEPSLAHMLDILTSKVLWIEEVHRLGFAINDLKNGNVMINRRGQFKGIDLDAYSPIFSPYDRLPDFFFLAVSALQLITRGAPKEVACVGSGTPLADPQMLKNFLSQNWPYHEVEAASQGRVKRSELLDFFVQFIHDSKGGVYAGDPRLFGRAIDHLILIKRQLSDDEMVLE